MTKEILVFLGLLLAISASNVRSNSGRSFLLPVYDIGDTLTLKIVTNNATKVSIKGPETDLILAVPAKSVRIQNVSVSQVGYSRAVNISVQNSALSVSAPTDFWLYAFVQDKSSAVGGLAAIPVKHLSNDYRVATYDTGYSSSFLTVAAVENNTIVSIMIKTVASLSCTSGNLTNGEIAVFTLNKNDVLGIECEFDITGSIIHSNSSIAVISGYSNFLDQELSLCIEMLIPVNSFGTEFVLPVPMADKESIFRIVPAEVPTEITIGVRSKIIPRHPGFLQVTFSKSKCIVVNSSCMVIVYSPTPQLGSSSMTEMSIVPSTDRFLSAYMAEMPEYEELFLNTATMGFKSFGPGGCMIINKVINMSDFSQNHNLKEPFGVILYELNEMVPILPLGMLYGMDMCKDDPCVNNATCMEVLNDFVCRCEPGFNGKFCEANINECASSPCINGGRCADGINQFICQCEPGFNGTFCENNIDECEVNPCENNATCIDGINEFTCKCPQGFNGTFCENNIDECQINPCLNNATCVDDINNFVCDCTPGFNGIFCETNINDCQNNTCRNNATCVDGINTFFCECAPGFNGTVCETNIDNCYSNPCQNNGSCLVGTDEFTCQCTPGFTGKLCETNNDECYSSPCLNNGSCVDGVNQFVCQCEQGFNGTLCEVRSSSPYTQACSRDPCQNNATCLNEQYGFLCQCMPGFTGDLCEQDIDECSNNPCQNDATCVDEIAAFTCQCEPGFTGIHCDTDIDECTTSPCRENQDCVNSQGNFSCQCKPGFIQPDCSYSLSSSSIEPTVTEYTYAISRFVSLDQSLLTYSGDIITDVVLETDIRFSSVYTPQDPSQSLKCNSTCLCTRYGNTSVEYIDQEDLVEGIKRRLLLDKNKLLKTTLKYISRPDDRPTAKGIGSLGCMIIIGTLLVLAVPDLFYVLRFSNRPLPRVEYVMK